MKVQLYSKTTAGKWAASLTLLFIILMYLKFFNLGIRIPLATPLIAGFGVMGFVIGIISFAKNKDRSLLTLASILIGLLIILWIVGEIAFPH